MSSVALVPRRVTAGEPAVTPDVHALARQMELGPFRASHRAGRGRVLHLFTRGMIEVRPRHRLRVIVDH